jgi:hypothetical protein
VALGDLQEEPSAGKPHARICEGESRMAELLDHPRAPGVPQFSTTSGGYALVSVVKSGVFAAPGHGLVTVGVC